MGGLDMGTRGQKQADKKYAPRQLVIFFILIKEKKPWEPEHHFHVGLKKDVIFGILYVVPSLLDNHGRPSSHRSLTITGHQQWCAQCGHINHLFVQIYYGNQTRRAKASTKFTWRHCWKGRKSIQYKKDKEQHFPITSQTYLLNVKFNTTRLWKCLHRNLGGLFRCFTWTTVEYQLSVLQSIH